MKARIILVCIALMSILAHAGELDDLLKNKETEYIGICRLDANGMLVFNNPATKTTPQCVVGAPPGEKDLKTVLIFDEQGPVKLFEYSIKEAKQRTLWTRGAI